MITIDDGTLTYASRRPTLLSWRPDNEIVFVLLLALVTTLIAYQVTVICFDIAFGHKPRHCTKVSDLLIHRLAWSASPIGFFRNVFSYYYAQLQETDHTVPTQPVCREERNTYIPFFTLAKLLFLLAVGPIMNIIAIILSTEFETELTFKQAGIGPLAMGLNKDLSTVRLSERGTQLEIGDSEIQIPIYAPNYDTSLVRFRLERSSLINQRQFTFPTPEFPDLLISLGQPGPASLMMMLLTPNDGVVVGLAFGSVEFLEGDGRNGLHIIKPFVDLDAVSELYNIATERLIGLCGSGLPQNGEIIRDHNMTTDIASVSRAINCTITRDDLEEVEGIFLDLMKRLTVVDGNEFQVTLASSPGLATFAAEDEPFVRRRSYLVGLPILLIIAAALTSVRVGTSVLTRNDVGTGIGFVIRYVRGRYCCDSMLVDDKDDAAG